jgi:hypothetical protein
VTIKIRLLLVGAAVALIAAVGSGPASAGQAQCVGVKPLGLSVPAVCVPLP